MKKMFFALMLVVPAAVLLSFSVIHSRLNEVLKTLELSEERAKESIGSSFMNASLDAPINRAIVGLAVGKRATVVNQLGDYMKSYLATPEFVNNYHEWRSGMLPKGWEAMIQERADEVIKDIDDDLAQAEASPEMKTKYAKEIKESKERKAALSDPKHPKRAQYIREIEEELKEREDMAGILKQYKEESAELEKKYPANVNDLIRSRLQEFLDVTASINFDAKLVTRKGKQYFEDPALEKKDYEWKRLFRCGKETITAARAYAQNWLKALPAKK